MTLTDSPPIPRLGRHSNGMRLEPAEFDAVTQWDRNCRYELVHGVVVVSPIAAEGEADPNGELEFLLRLYQTQHPKGAALDKTLPERYIHLPDSRRRADRVIWAGLGRLPVPSVDVPTIAVEFVSKSERDRHRDYIEKRRDYREAGVKEYWIIDRFQNVMTICFADGTEQRVEASGVYTPPLLPGFELPLQRLLNVANQWK